MARGLKFRIQKAEGLYYPCSETKALISFAVTAKLICVFVYAYTKTRFSHDEAQIIMNIRICREFVDRMDNSVLRVTVWQTHVEYFFLHTFKFQRLNKFNFYLKINPGPVTSHPQVCGCVTARHSCVCHLEDN